MMASEDPNRLLHIGILRSVLFVYDKDLERCKDLLNRQFNLFPTGDGSIKEKSALVKDLLEKVSIKPESPS